MANWGQPDFTDTITAADQAILWDRIKREGAENRVQWSHNDQVERGYDAREIQEHCVRDAEWQQTRLSMKGVPTHKKLAILEAWWDKHHGKRKSARGFDICALQVGNYLGALRRGGQLDDLNAVRKYI